MTQAPAVGRARTREPVQERARRRRESILDATARLLDREGYGALTTNAVAREAQAAIGTVYEYFPNREALLAALLARHGERLGEVIDRAIVGAGGDPIATGDRVVDAFARFWLEEPGYRSAWAVSQVSGVLLETGAAWADAFTDRVAALIASIAPSLPARERRRVAHTAVHLVSGLVGPAVSGPRAQRRARLDEAKLALRAYVLARLGG